MHEDFSLSATNLMQGSAALGLLIYKQLSHRGASTAPEILQISPALQFFSHVGTWLSRSTI